MAKKKKNDFWEDVEEDIEISDNQTSSYNENDKEEQYNDQEGFKATKSMPLKIITRLLLFVAAAALVVSGYITYRYVGDRYDGGFTSGYFSSKGFSEEYNKAVTNLLKIMDAIEKDPALADSQESINSLTEGILGTAGNFSFLVQDANKTTLYASSEEARTHIESSNHFLRINTVDTVFSVDLGGVPTTGLNQSAWKSSTDNLANMYIIYTAVDNNLAQSGVFYNSYMEYQKLTEQFSIARIVGIVALVVFIALLVFCVMCTGRRKGYSDIHLSVFDRIFTEIAAIISIGVLAAIGFGMKYVHTNQVLPNFNTYIMIAGAALLYIVLIRSYFSLVRRIKTGEFVANSLLYKLGHQINMGLDHLPKAAKGVVIALLLIILNGGLVLALLFGRGVTVHDIPVIFIAAPIIFLIELIAVLCCLLGGTPGDAIEEDYDDVPEIDEEEEQATDWDQIDFGKAVSNVDVGVLPAEEPETDMGMTQENVFGSTADRTVMLTPEETDELRQQADAADAVSAAEVAGAAVVGGAALDSMEATQMLDTDEINAAIAPEDDTWLDFIQLNKDVRKMFRLKLKAKSIGVTLRAPEKPIMLDIDKSNAIKVLSILFDNVEKYAEEGSRVYIEMYTQKGKMVYMMKNTIKEELLKADITTVGESLNEAKRIIKAEGGKFITTVDGNVFKAGILLTAMR